MSCQEVRTLFPRLKTLDTERRGRVRGHLDRCEDCFSVLMEQVTQEEGLEKEALPVSMLESARGIVSAYLIARQGVLGMMWEKVRQAVAQGEEWAKERLAEGRKWIEGAMRLWQLSPAPAFPPLPVPALGATKGLAAEVMDDTWQPQNRVVSFEVREEEEGPRVTADGRFTFTLHTPEAQWQGAQVMCTLLLVEGQRVSFESVVEPDPSGQGGQVRFMAEGLPPKDIPVPLELLHLYLIAPDRTGG
jgi:hypothetical protein